MLNLEKQKHYFLFGSCVWIFPSIEKTLIEYILQDWHHWDTETTQGGCITLGQGLT